MHACVYMHVCMSVCTNVHTRCADVSMTMNCGYTYTHDVAYRGGARKRCRGGIKGDAQRRLRIDRHASGVGQSTHRSSCDGGIQLEQRVGRGAGDRGESCTNTRIVNTSAETCVCVYVCVCVCVCVCMYVLCRLKHSAYRRQ